MVGWSGGNALDFRSQGNVGRTVCCGAAVSSPGDIRGTAQRSSTVGRGNGRICAGFPPPRTHTTETPRTMLALIFMHYCARSGAAWPLRRCQGSRLAPGENARVQKTPCWSHPARDWEGWRCKGREGRGGKRRGGPRGEMKELVALVYHALCPLQERRFSGRQAGCARGIRVKGSLSGGVSSKIVKAFRFDSAPGGSGGRIPSRVVSGSPDTGTQRRATYSLKVSLVYWHSLSQGIIGLLPRMTVTASSLRCSRTRRRLCSQCVSRGGGRAVGCAEGIRRSIKIIA